MENCAIYSHFLNLEEVLNKLEKEFKKGFVIQTYGDRHNWSKIIITHELDNSIYTFNCQKKLIPSYKLSEPSDNLTKNLLGMYNFFKSIPAQDQEVQDKLLFKISSFNLQIGVKGVPCFTSETKAIIIQIAKILEGMIFSGQNSIFNLNGASNAIFDENGVLVLDTMGRSDVKDLNVVIESKYYLKNKNH